MMAAVRQNTPEPSLQTLFAGFVDPEFLPAVTVEGLAIDSREIQSGYLFLACSGSVRHGVHFIDDAIANGAIAVALESTTETKGLDLSAYTVPVFWVERLQQVAGIVAARFYGDPSRAMKVVGITGTNGKTSVSQFIAQCLHEQAPSGVIGTLGSGCYGRLDKTGMTTPDAINLQRQLAEMLDEGIKVVAMEVSSHALDQGRVNGVQFDVAVFTNLSHEHLDYHGDMASYAEAKHQLLKMPGLKSVVINADDAIGREWLQTLPQGVSAYGYTLAAEAPTGIETVLQAESLTLDAAGLSMRVRAGEYVGHLQSGLLGRFNASNLLAALGALLALDYSFDHAVASLSKVTTVPGRMEAFGGRGRPLVVVDYAHTPDALSQVLSALREHTARQLWCIFGCGGERDREKRPLMGKIAEQLADNVVITDDNPRRENPFNIIEGILGGIENPDAVYINRDRAQAIAHTIGLARPGDVILVAGKGHETEQQIDDRKIPFSDRQEVAQLFGEEVRDV